VGAGLNTTFELLATTANEASVGALLPALDSPLALIQENAVRAILRRRSPLGQREVLRRLHLGGERWREILAEYQGRLSSALRDAVLANDPQHCANGCSAIVWFGEYDLIPTLITATEDASNVNLEIAAQTLLEVTELLYHELAAPRDYRQRRDPQLVRRHVVGSLESSIQRFAKHKRREIIEAALVLMGRDNVTLKLILKQPHHPAYLTILEVLTHSTRPGVLRLLLSFLDDPTAPTAAMGVLAHRRDIQYLNYLLRKIGAEPSQAAAHNLKRVENIVWLRDDFRLLDELDEAGQEGAMQFALASNMKRLDVFPVIEHLLRYGNAGGRRAAAVALADFNGADANALTLLSLEDSDPEVQTAAISQLRSRCIPGAISRLLDKLDSPHEMVRHAARESLGEFTLERYLAAFEMLEEGARKSTGVIVRKVDALVVPRLREEFLAKSRTRRIRAAQAAAALGIVPELEPLVLELAQNEDHILRVAACQALAAGRTMAARETLEDALRDRCVAVQEAARESLEKLE
jgi:HEAT repeat protein